MVELQPTQQEMTEEQGGERRNTHLVFEARDTKGVKNPATAVISVKNPLGFITAFYFSNFLEGSDEACKKADC